MREIFIGDVHGCLEELQALLQACSYERGRDRLVSVGDLVHKGPASAAVLRFFLDEPQAGVLYGNHEHQLWRALAGKEAMYPEAYAILQGSGLERAKLARWLRDLPRHLRTQHAVAIHAGYQPLLGSDLSCQEPKTLFTIRYVEARTLRPLSKLPADGGPVRAWQDLLPAESPWGLPLVYGHWAGPAIRRHHGWTYGLDTGCCYGGHLSALILPERRIVQVRSRQPLLYPEYANAAPFTEPARG